MTDETFKPYIHKKQYSGVKNLLKRQPACYLIIHTESKKVYVGSTNDLSRRCTENLNDLKNKEHKNKNLQEKYNSSPEVEIVYHPCNNPEEALALEQKVVDRLKQTELLLNIATENVALTGLGAKLTKEHIQILADSNRNRSVSQESKARMKESQIKFFNSEAGEERKRQIQKQKGREVTIDGRTYPSINQASKELNIPHTTLGRKLKRSA